MSEDQFYEDDEPMENLRAAWNAGEKGATSGPRDLNQRQKSIIDRTVARFEGRQEVVRVVASGTSATTEFRNAGQTGSPVERVRNDAATASAYPVG